MLRRSGNRRTSFQRDQWGTSEEVRIGLEAEAR